MQLHLPRFKYFFRNVVGFFIYPRYFNDFLRCEVAENDGCGPYPKVFEESSCIMLHVNHLLPELFVVFLNTRDRVGVEAVLSEDAFMTLRKVKFT